MKSLFLIINSIQYIFFNLEYNILEEGNMLWNIFESKVFFIACVLGTLRIFYSTFGNKMYVRV